MDETRLRDELLARLSVTVDRSMLQTIDGALTAVLRDYDVSRRKTELSTEVVTWPEYDMFMGRMIFGGYSKSTIRQYGTFIRELLVYVGKPESMLKAAVENCGMNMICILHREETLKEVV